MAALSVVRCRAGPGADQVELPATGGPGERTRREGDPALEAGGMATHQKKAQKLRATIVLVNESGLSAPSEADLGAAGRHPGAAISL
jgi:hypothetical protein